MPTCLPAVLTAARLEPRQDDWVWHGVDLNLMLVVAALVFTSPFLFGGLGVFNCWFFSIVVLALLLAWRELSRSPGWAADQSADDALFDPSHSGCAGRLRSPSSPATRRPRPMRS